jgi:enamine deaminase RidA (YjgF/YER057c/UK114 family)
MYISGQAPIKDGRMQYTGKVGANISIEDGIRAAELCCINIIAALKQGTNGNWDQLDSFVKLGGFVNSPDDFTDHPKIINGASDLLVKIFGDQGRHARFAVGSNSLPMNISVEIDAIIKIK